MNSVDRIADSAARSVRGVARLVRWSAAPLLLFTMTAYPSEEKSLAERLGYKATDKLLIVNGDDAGMCHSANLATIDCQENGLMRSATIMVPGDRRLCQATSGKRFWDPPLPYLGVG
jgi:hypothetical protein